MKKIGILTFQGANNFGAALQNYGLVFKIKEMGYSVETINYQSKKIEETHKKQSLFFKSGNLLKSAYRTMWNLVNYKKYCQCIDNFNLFRQRYLNLSESVNNTSIYSKDNDYDVFICGSDQIWSDLLIVEEDYTTYSLDFVTKKKKASYAASAGTTDSLNRKMIKMISNLDIISVRENSLMNYLQKIGIDAEMVIDPTLLLYADDWKKLANTHIVKRDKPYVFMYHLESRVDECRAIAQNIANERNLDLISPIFLDRKTLFNTISCLGDGPIEFLNEILYADFVVVSSFHGTVFSILFEKNFISILHKKTGERVRDFLSNLGLLDRIVDSYEEYLERRETLQAINYFEVNQKLDELRKRSQDLLSSICRL